MKIRPAGLLDLARIEEMHRSSDIRLSEAAPAARLWTVLSSTLSALLPLTQETLIYVAEENGKVVGFIQASGQPLGLDLPPTVFARADDEVIECGGALHDGP